ncbi:MAG: P1 family peptidase [Candidatus Aminicenantes bacterium]|nr:P1 family peptidase [Candidatus Aminicenantes bacterium]
MRIRRKVLCLTLALGAGLPLPPAARGRLRDYGIAIGVLAPGKWNAITDVAGVAVGHLTLEREPGVRTGVTVVLPHGGNLFRQKVPAAIHVGNGFGKLVGSTQVAELGNIESPIALTNTLSVPEAMAALVEHALAQPGNEEVRSVNVVVGETNDGFLNDIRARALTKADVLAAIRAAASGPVPEGNVGAGTGCVCFGFKGGIGTSSRVLPPHLGGYTVGVLVQANFGGILSIGGLPAGEILGRHYLRGELESGPGDGSCMIVIATDAPLLARNLERLAKRAMLGLARTGGIAANGSGDYAVAFSTAAALRVPTEGRPPGAPGRELANDALSPLFLAVIEATEEAILNALFQAEAMEGFAGHRVEALPLDRLLPLLRRAQEQ